MRPGEPETWSRLSGEKSLALPGIILRFLGLPSRNSVLTKSLLSFLDENLKVIEA
jgi:hypothetical protein